MLLCHAEFSCFGANAGKNSLSPWHPASRRGGKKSMPTSEVSSSSDTLRDSQPHQPRSGEEKALHRKRNHTPERMQKVESGQPSPANRPTTNKTEATRGCGWDGWFWTILALSLWACLLFVTAVKTPECESSAQKVQPKVSICNDSLYEYTMIQSYCIPTCSRGSMIFCRETAGRRCYCHIGK